VLHTTTNERKIVKGVAADARARPALKFTGASMNCKSGAETNVTSPAL